MAKIKIIGIGGNRIVSRGAGWQVDGLFFATQAEVIAHCQGGDIPTSDEIEAYEDECLGHDLDEIETNNERVAEMRMRQI